MANATVIDGAQSFYILNGEVGIILLHGFVGTPQSVKYVGEQLANRGFTVLAPRLFGHGTTPEELATATFEHWFADVKEAVQQVRQACKRVYIAGQSMGGALSLIAASEFDVDGVITINAALDVPCYHELLTQDYTQYIPEGAPDINDQTATEIVYDKVPLKAVHQLFRVMGQAKATVPFVRKPALLLYSPEDHVVPASQTQWLAQQLRHKRVAELSNSYHVATLDYDKVKIVDEIEDFIRQL